MAFKGNRGMVLRTTRAMSVDNKTGNGKTQIKAGTRVKFMSDLGKGEIRVKVKDPNYPKAVQGAHVELKVADVTRVERGRPDSEGGEGKAKAAAKKPAGKKTAAKKGGAKKTAAKKSAAKKSGGKPKAAPAPVVEAEEPTSDDLEEIEGDLADLDDEEDD